MENLILLLFLFLTANTLSVYTLRKHCGLGSTRITSPTIFYIFFFIMVNIGSTIIAFCPDLLTNVINPNLLEEKLLTQAYHMNLGLLFFSLAISITSYITGFNYKIENINFTHKPLILRDRSTHILLINLMALISIVIIISFLLTLDYVPLTQAIVNIFSNQSSELSQMRQELTAESNIPGWILQFIRIILPFCLLYVWASSRHFKNKSNKIWLAMLSLTTIYFLFSLGQRSPLLDFLLTAYVVNNLYKPHKKISFLLVCKISIVLLLAFLGMTILLERTGEGLDFAERIIENINEVFYRIFITYAQTGSYIYQLFPHYIDFQDFNIYYDNLRGYLPGQVRSFSVELFSFVHDWKGSASHSSLAEAYASFNLLGVIVCSIIIGASTQYSTIRLFRRAKTDLNIITYGFTSIILSATAIGSLLGVFYNGIISLILINILLNVATVITTKRH